MVLPGRPGQHDQRSGSIFPRPGQKLFSRYAVASLGIKFQKLPVQLKIGLLPQSLQQSHLIPGIDLPRAYGAKPEFIDSLTKNIYPGILLKGQYPPVIFQQHNAFPGGLQSNGFMGRILGLRLHPLSCLYLNLRRFHPVSVRIRKPADPQGSLLAIPCDMAAQPDSQPPGLHSLHSHGLQHIIHGLSVKFHLALLPAHPLAERQDHAA